MTQQLDMGRFLEQHRADGSADSEGSFTVSHTNAARKLARFSLPRPYAWVSKLIQAAVGWQCDELRIGQGRTVTQFHFRTQRLKDLPTEQELVNTMLSGKVGGTLPIENFCIGLRSLVEQADLSFLLVIDDGEVNPQPIYAGHHFGSLSEGERLSNDYRAGPGITLSVNHIPSTESDPLMFVANSCQLKIVEEIQSHCYMSPIPINLSGRRLDGLLSSTQFGASERYRPIFLSGVQACQGSPETMPLPQGFEEKRLSVFTHPGRALRSYEGRKGFAAACLVGLHLPRILTRDLPPTRHFSHICWVREGVVVDRTRLSAMTHLVGCQFFLNADDLKTDLTGFQLVATEEKAERETWAVRAIMQMLSGEDFPSFCFRPDEDELSVADAKADALMASKRRVKILLKGSGTGLFLTLLNPPLGVPATLAGIIAAYFPRRNKLHDKLTEYRSEYVSTLKTDLKHLQECLKSWTCLLPVSDSGIEFDADSEL